MKLFNKSALLLALLLTAALAFAAMAQGAKTAKPKGPGPKNVSAEKAGKFLGKGDGIETCPVTGETLGNKDIKADFYNRTVYFCCEGCLVKARKSPALYLKQTAEAQIAATKNLPKSAGHGHDHHAATKPAQKGEQEFLGKGDGVETCPVTGEPVNKNVKTDINGRTVYVCCEGCLATVKKNPELYLKPAAEKTEEQKEQPFLGKGDGLETCPVMGGPVNKSLKSEINGRVFYVCCEGCIDTVKKNPDAYLKKAQQ